jgi:hypothetical protein
VCWILRLSTYPGLENFLLRKSNDVTGACECHNEHSGSIKCREFLDSFGLVSFSERILLHVAVKVKQSCYRPGVAQRVPGS